MTPERKRMIRLAWLCGLAILVLTGLLDLLVYHKPHFAQDGITIDTMPEFFPVFGFVSSLLFVLIAKTFQIAVKRKDSYYSDD